MPDLPIPDLTFPEIGYGTHGTPIDLRVLLYQGGAGWFTTSALLAIEQGSLGEPLLNRLQMVIKLHEVLAADLARGLSQVTVSRVVRSLRTFYSWADDQSLGVTLESAPSDFKIWTEALLHRVRIEKPD